MMWQILLNIDESKKYEELFVITSLKKENMILVDLYEFTKILICTLRKVKAFRFTILCKLINDGYVLIENTKWIIIRIAEKIHQFDFYTFKEAASKLWGKNKMFETSYGSDSKCAVFPRSRKMF